MAAQEAQMDALLKELEETRASVERAEKRAEELSALASSGQTAANILEFDEATTRSQIIDSLLTAAGWNVGAGCTSTSEVAKEVEVLHQSTTTGVGYADYVLLDDDGARLYRSLWKISSGKNMADNYWRDGNFLAPIEAGTGVVLDVVEGGGENRRSIKTHPDTGKNLVGFTVPDWEEAVDLCLRAASVVPDLKIQGWDIALTDHGPVLLEVNVVGGVGLPQNAFGRGMYDPELADFVRRHSVPENFR